jgi:4-oxalocrotonate tautomerase
LVAVVIVEMWEGRTVEQKRKLVEAITAAMKEHCGAGTEHLHVIIHDVPQECWGRDGKLTAGEKNKWRILTAGRVFKPAGRLALFRCVCC